MSVSARMRLAGTWAGALGALLVCGLLLPSRAQAGCSYYAIHRASLGDAMKSHDPTVESLALAIADPTSPTEGPRPPAPCSGPSCSRRTEGPTPPSVSTTRFVEPWAYLAESLKRSDPGATPLDVHSHRLRPIHRGEPNPRPPRSIHLLPASIA